MTRMLNNDTRLLVMRRTVFFRSQLLVDRFTPEADNSAVNQRNAVDRELVISERRQVDEMHEHQ